MTFQLPGRRRMRAASKHASPPTRSWRASAISDNSAGSCSSESTQYRCSPCPELTTVVGCMGRSATSARAWASESKSLKSTSTQTTRPVLTSSAVPPSRVRGSTPKNSAHRLPLNRAAMSARRSSSSSSVNQHRSAQMTLPPRLSSMGRISMCPSSPSNSIRRKASTCWPAAPSFIADPRRTGSPAVRLTARRRRADPRAGPPNRAGRTAAQVSPRSRTSRTRA